MTKHGKPDMPSHHRLVVEVGNAVRKMGAQSVITSRVVADHFGLHMTDLEVLDLIFLRKQASAGELAEATGLSSGAVTALIDRLAGAGYVERAEDPRDRRRVIVRVRPDAIEPIKAAYMAIQKHMFDLWSTYSAEDLEVILDFTGKSTALAVECCKSLRQAAPPATSRRRAPRTSSGAAAAANEKSPAPRPPQRRKPLR